MKISNKYLKLFTPFFLITLYLLIYPAILSASPNFDIWYGSQQNFGQLGNPQVWVNILGNVSSLPDEIVSLEYSLNSGPFIPLSIGPDSRRLCAKGDFCVEIDYTDLTDGANLLVLRATDDRGSTAQESVTINYETANIWPENYQIDWSMVTNIQDAIQIVDGLWTITPQGLRTIQIGYDRLLAIGDIFWDNYEITLPVTVHDYDPNGFAWPSNYPGLGIFLRWTGHTDDPVYCGQPHCGWFPCGGAFWYDWDSNGGVCSNVIQDQSVWDCRINPLEFNVCYNLKMRVETIAGQGNLYSAKLWRNGDLEPSSWGSEKILLSNVDKGSALLLAHHVDVTIGDITVLKIGESAPALMSQDFDSYQTGQDPIGWFDTAAYNSMSENDSLFKIFDVSGQKVMGTTSTLINIHSHFIEPSSANWTNYEYAGRMRITDTGSGIGVTFLSNYPNSDSYYRLRREDSRQFHIAPHGTTITGGTINTGVIPQPNTWYNFRIHVEDTGTQTEIKAKLWQQGNNEPLSWQADCFDASPTRLTSGTVGLWSMREGIKYWDSLTVQPLGQTYPTAPVLSAIGDKTVTVNNSLSFTITATDPDGDAITYSVLNLPSGAAFSGNTFSWTPQEGQAGNYSVTFIASDGQLQDSETITITVIQPPPPENDELIGYWKFDDGSGNLAIDSSGKDSTATLINGPVWTTGRFNGALSFDGKNDAVRIPTTNVRTNSGTISLWAYQNGTRGTQYFFGHSIGKWSNVIQLYIKDKKGKLYVGLGDSERLAQVFQGLKQKAWHHLVLTWDAGKYVVYVNGVQEATGTYSGLANLNTFAEIGNDGNDNLKDGSFNGIIDEVRLYNYAIPDAMAQQLYKE